MDFTIRSTGEGGKQSPEIEKRNPKTLVVSINSNGAVLYQVPSGRVFKGRLEINTNGMGNSVSLNGTAFYSNFYGGSGTTVAGAGALSEFILYSGDTLVSSDSSRKTLVGVEYDA